MRKPESTIRGSSVFLFIYLVCLFVYFIPPGLLSDSCENWMENWKNHMLKLWHIGSQPGYGHYLLYQGVDILTVALQFVAITQDNTYKPGCLSVFIHFLPSFVSSIHAPQPE